MKQLTPLAALQQTRMMRASASRRLWITLSSALKQSPQYWHRRYQAMEAKYHRLENLYHAWQEEIDYARRLKVDNARLEHEAAARIEANLMGRYVEWHKFTALADEVLRLRRRLVRVLRVAAHYRFRHEVIDPPTKRTGEEDIAYVTRVHDWAEACMDGYYEQRD